MARPSPVPPYRRVVEPSAWVKGSKDRRHACPAGCRCPCPRPRNAADRPRLRPRPPAATADTTSPSSVNLTALPDQVDQDLAQPARVAPQRGGDVRVDRHGQLQPLARGPASRASPRRPRALARRSKSSASSSSLPGLDLGEVEDVVDDGQQRLAADFARRPTYSRCSSVSSVSSSSSGHADARRSSGCGSRGSCWPGTRSWPGWPLRRGRPSVARAVAASSCHGSRAGGSSASLRAVTSRRMPTAFQPSFKRMAEKESWMKMVRPALSASRSSVFPTAVPCPVWRKAESGSVGVLKMRRTMNS